MEEKKIELFKPNAAIYFGLFIFYAIWVLQAFNSVVFYYTFGFDEFKDYDLLQWSVVPLFCAGGLYCLYSVVKFLRGDSDCVTALKWALIYSFLYTFFNSSRAQIPTYSTWAIISVFLARPLFYLGFYLYLCFSKGVKRRYPKQERRFAPSGYVWSAITACLAGIIVWSGYDSYKTYEYCKRVDLGNIMLEKGEISDGYVAFRSGMAWKVSSGHLDTIRLDDGVAVCRQTMEAEDSLRSVTLFSGRSEKRDARTHNQFLTRLLADLDKDVVEKSFIDTIADGKHLICTTFTTKTDMNPKKFSIASVFDTDSPKCVVFASKARGDDDHRWLKEILDSLRWNLDSVP